MNGERKLTTKNGYFKAGLKLIGDYGFGKNFFRTKENYLFKSDHFGLISTFKVK